MASSRKQQLLMAHFTTQNGSGQSCDVLPKVGAVEFDGQALYLQCKNGSSNCK